MTRNSNFKKRIRARAARTGESYTTALSHLRPSGTSGEPRSSSVSLRLAVAQLVPCDDPLDAAALHRCGMAIRELMREARRAGARLVHFPEGALCSPNKRIMSSLGRDTVGPSDWERCCWPVLREELVETSKLAGELGLWTVLGSVHRLSAGRRPHNSLYVISERGELATRYDERMLSHTKVSFMYTPGAEPVTFAVDGVRFGCALGMETHYPEIFFEYEQMDVDCVLVSTTGSEAFAVEAQGHAASNSFWISYSVHAGATATAAGIARPDGPWAARCDTQGNSLALVDITTDPEGPARPWRRKARSGIYEPHRVDDDPRSRDRAAF